MNMLKLGTVSMLQSLFNKSIKSNINNILDFPSYTLCDLNFYCHLCERLCAFSYTGNFFHLQIKQHPARKLQGFFDGG